MQDETMIDIENPQDNDLINRQAVINSIGSTEIRFSEVAWRVLMEAINNIPSVNPSANVIEVPDGATNGDMIKALFPNIEVETRGLITNAKRLDFDESYDQGKPFRTDWWNAPYKG